MIAQSVFNCPGDFKVAIHLALDFGLCDIAKTIHKTDRRLLEVEQPYDKPMFYLAKSYDLDLLSLLARKLYKEYLVCEVSGVGILKNAIKLN